MQIVLEVGCGTGNLAPYFLNEGYEYTGIDLHEEMLRVARDVAPQAAFIQGDMRSLDPGPETTFKSIIIAGRSFTYLTANHEVMNTLSSLYRTLEPGGLLMFDNFRAENIFLHFKDEIIQMAEYDGRKYRRVNRTSKNLETGWTWN